MAFEGLSSKLQNVFKKLGGKGKLSEKEVREAMREVKLALLEADVNFAVVKNFVNKVTERAVGSEVLESLTPAQQVIKIVNEELEQQIRQPLEEVCIAAAGRVLKTAAIHVEYEYAEETVVTGEDIHTLNLLGIEKAQGLWLEGNVEEVCVKRFAVDVYDRGRIAPDGQLRAALVADERRVVGVFSLLVLADDRRDLQ